MHTAISVIKFGWFMICGDTSASSRSLRSRKVFFNKMLYYHHPHRLFAWTVHRHGPLQLPGLVAPTKSIPIMTPSCYQADWTFTVPKFFMVVTFLLGWCMGSHGATPLYPNIAGEYTFTENYQWNITNSKLGKKVINGRVRGRVVITQNGNRITYKAINTTSGKVSYTRTGYLTGNDIRISGIAALGTTLGSGITLTKNTFSASGTVQENMIVLNGKGTIKATRGTTKETILITSTATLEGPVTPAEVGRVRVVVSPVKSGTATGISGDGVYPTGTSLTLSARQAKGYYFVNWSEADEVISTEPNLELSASGSLRILKATFAKVGSAHFSGLFQSVSPPTSSTVGLLKASLNSTSSLSAGITFQGSYHSFSGAFDRSWELNRVIKRSGRSSLMVSLHLDPATKQLSGIIKTSDDLFFGNVSLSPLPVYTRSSPCPFAGKFNLLLPAATELTSPPAPPGTGHLVMTILSTGAAMAVGKLADNTSVSTSGRTNSSNQVDLFKYLYARNLKTPGAIFGELLLQDSAGSQDTCGGALYWHKPKQSTGTYYREGFETILSALGAKYAFVKNTRALNLTSLVISSGGIDELTPIMKTISVSTANVVSVKAPNLEKVKIAINTKTGSFKGSFLHPVRHKTIFFGGLLCQHTESPQAGGFFLGPVQSGRGTIGNISISP